MDWVKYQEVASRFEHKARREDREDINHTIILSLAQAQLSLDSNGGGRLSDVAMLRIASYEVADYWRTQYKLTNGLDCGSCSKAQRAKCRSENLYSKCPKAIKLEYLSKPISDGDGNITELGELIADDKAIDLDAWLDARTFLLGCPKRLIAVAVKRRDGIPLTKYEQLYLCRYWKKRQKRLWSDSKLLPNPDIYSGSTV
jgi:hypothetical protein